MSGRVAAIIAVLCIALVGVAAIAGPSSEILASILFGCGVVSFVTMGATLIARVPGHPIGPLLLVAGVLMSTGMAAGVYAIVGSSADPIWPGVVPAALYNEVTFFYPIVIVLIGVPLVFPSGQLLSSRWRSVALVTIAAMAANTVAFLFDPGDIEIVGMANPFGAPALVPLLDALSTFSSVTSIYGFGGAAASVIVRYRRGDRIERQQVKWLATVAAVAGVAFPTAILFPDSLISPVGFLTGVAALISLPLAIGVAMLRYRLYEIDRIVSRTLTYAGLTVGLFGLFLAANLVAQWALSRFTGGNAIAVAASTLVAAAAFSPLRSRLQGAVDRRFNRGRYDAQLTIDAFADRLRDELDLATVSEVLQRSAGAAVEPAHTAVWLRGMVSR